MLLQPRNSMEAHCQPMKLNIDDTDPVKYFLCENRSCSEKRRLCSTFWNQGCCCAKLMSRIVSRTNLIPKNGFVKETATFIISDDLFVLPNVAGTSVDLLQNLGIYDMDALQEQTVDISKKDVVDLLKFSLFSKTPLSDFILKKKEFVDEFNRGSQSQFEIGNAPSDE